MATTRADAIGILEDGHRSVQSLFTGIGADEFARRGTIGGGDWSAKDLAGHLADWEEYALRTRDEWRRRERPWVEDIDTDEVNDRSIARHLADASDAVRARFADMHSRLLSELGAMTEDEWQAPPFFGSERPRPLGDLLGAVLGGPDGPFRHADAHLPDLRAYVATVRT